MQTLRKRKEFFHRWEYENQQQFLKLTEVSKAVSQKQIAAAARSISFLLYLAFEVIRWCKDLLRALLISPMGIEKRLAEAERKRFELNTHPSLWLR